MVLWRGSCRQSRWAQGGIGAVVNSGLMRGFPDNTFRPLKSITRAEAVVSLDRALNANGKEVNVKSGIEGKVSLNGIAIANAVVKVFQADSFKVMEETKTDSNGNYKFNLSKGKYDLTATTENEVGYKSDVNVLDNQLTTQALSLEKAAILSGDLEDKDKRTVKNATIAFTTNPTFVTTTDKDGKFKVAVLANRDYTVRAYNPDEKDQAPDVVTEGLKVGTVGKQQVGTLKAHFAVKSSSGGSSGGGNSPDTVVIEKEIPVGQPVSIGKVDKPTKVKAEVKLPSGNSIAMEIDIPATGTTCSLKIEEIAAEVPIPDPDPETPFLGLNITLEGAPGKEVTIALPLPTGLNSENVAAYHYNTDTGMWDYREASVINGKVVFKTTLSPVAVSKKMTEPGGLKASNVTNNSVTLQWTAVDKATMYIIFRDNEKIGQTSETSYKDTNLAAGVKYTYTVVACNKNKFTSKKSTSKTIRTAAIAIPGNNLLEILNAVEEALDKISPEDWEKLKANRDRFLKVTYSEQISKLVAKGVNQQVVYDYVVELYDGILTGEYVIRNNNDYYESDLYDAALKELRNGSHTQLATVAKDAFDRVKKDYSTVNEGDSEFKKLLKEIIGEQEFDTITGSKVCLMKEYLISEVKGDDDDKYKTIVAFLDLIINTSKVFIPTQS